jgi:EmrB/QacA subfamily drug resistance transporter
LTDTPVTPADRRLTIWALLVVLLLSALDQTIVATAMPRIIEQLQGLSMYAWVTTAYMLASTVSVPIYGKLSDLHGRKPILVFGVLMFLAGSVLCGLAGEFGSLPVLGGGMMQLILFRGIQGLGSGALMSMAFAVIADLFAPRERGRVFGIFASVFGVATVIGPFIGGFLTDHGTVTLLGYEIAGWRWVFYVNLPLGLCALFMILYRMPVLRPGGGGRVDYIGAALVILTFVPLLLALSLGGTRYPWDSPRILALFGGSAVSLVALLWFESRTPDAIVPLRLFGIPTFRTATLASFVMNMAFLGVVMFMPLYMQVVQGINATGSGLAILPLMGGLMVSSTASGRLVTRTGRYKPFMIVGGVVLIIGVVLLTRIGSETTTGDLAWRLVVTGLGLGPAQTLFNLVIQNAAPPTDIGVATSMSQFSRQIGATVGVAIFGTFLTHSLTAELPKHVPLLPGMSEHQIDLAHAQTQAMNAGAVQARVDSTLKERFEVIERAYEEDPQAVAEILADPRMPAESVDTLERELKKGPAGRDRLLQDPRFSAMVKEQFANIPVRAFSDPELMASVSGLFRQTILAQENALVAAEIAKSLQTVHAAMASYSKQLTERVGKGIKESFAISIAQMMQRSLWIVFLGVFVILFIPELPLRTQPAAAAAPAAD